MSRVTMSPVRETFPWGSLEWLASGALDNAAELSLARMTLRTGQAIDAHVHDNAEESIYVVRGEVECRMADRTERLAAGQCAIVPRGDRHLIVNVGSGDAELVLNYSSARRRFALA